MYQQSGAEGRALSSPSAGAPRDADMQAAGASPLWRSALDSGPRNAPGLDSLLQPILPLPTGLASTAACAAASGGSPMPGPLGSPTANFGERNDASTMLRSLMQVLSQLREPADGPVPVQAWRQAVLMLVSQLSVKRRRASVEETLPTHMLSILIRAMPKAVPELARIGGGALDSPETQEAMLRGPHLRAAIDEKVFTLVPSLEQSVDEKQVLSCMILSLLTAVAGV